MRALVKRKGEDAVIEEVARPEELIGGETAVSWINSGLCMMYRLQRSRDYNCHIQGYPYCGTLVFFGTDENLQRVDLNTEQEAYARGCIFVMGVRG